MLRTSTDIKENPEITRIKSLVELLKSLRNDIQNNEHPPVFKDPNSHKDVKQDTKTDVVYKFFNPVPLRMRDTNRAKAKSYPAAVAPSLRRLSTAEAARPEDKDPLRMEKVKAEYVLTEGIETLTLQCMRHELLEEITDHEAKNVEQRIRALMKPTKREKLKEFFKASTQSIIGCGYLNQEKELDKELSGYHEQYDEKEIADCKERLNKCRKQLEECVTDIVRNLSQEKKSLQDNLKEAIQEGEMEYAEFQRHYKSDGIAYIEPYVERKKLNYEIYDLVQVKVEELNTSCQQYEGEKEIGNRFKDYILARAKNLRPVADQKDFAATGEKAKKEVNVLCDAIPQILKLVHTDYQNHVNSKDKIMNVNKRMGLIHIREELEKGMKNPSLSVFEVLQGVHKKIDEENNKVPNAWSLCVGTQSAYKVVLVEAKKKLYEFIKEVVPKKGQGESQVPLLKR